MNRSLAEQCRHCIATLKSLVSVPLPSGGSEGRIKPRHVVDELERFSLWAGNIGALHDPQSSMSLESRLRDNQDVLAHTQELLDELSEVAQEREYHFVELWLRS
jgi:hypothetical protein